MAEIKQKERDVISRVSRFCFQRHYRTDHNEDMYQVFQHNTTNLESSDGLKLPFVSSTHVSGCFAENYLDNQRNLLHVVPHETTKIVIPVIQVLQQIEETFAKCGVAS